MAPQALLELPSKVGDECAVNFLQSNGVHPHRQGGDCLGVAMNRENLFARVSATVGANRRWEAPIESVSAVLELTASEYPGLLEFQAHVLRNSTMSFAVQRLAAAFEVPDDQVGRTVLRAGKDLDRLERIRAAWRDPAKILDSPNLPALIYIGYARLNRVSKLTRQRHLEVILRRVQRAYELARSRAWIEAFIGPLPAKPEGAQGANR